MVAVIGLAALVSSSVGASAQVVPAYTTDPASEIDLGAYGLSAFEFTLNQNVNLTALGFTALSLGGGDAPHVTLWDASGGLGALTQIYDTGNILSSVTSTGQGTSSGTPSFVSVGTPIALTAGVTYLVSAPAYWVATFDPSSITTDSAIATSSFLTNGTGQWNGWANSGYNFSTLAPPSGASTFEIPTTPNLEYVVVVPEPSTYAMMGLGFLALLGALRLRSKSRLS